MTQALVADEHTAGTGGRRRWPRLHYGGPSDAEASSDWPGEAAGRSRGLTPARAAPVSSTFEPVEPGTILTLEVEVSSPARSWTREDRIAWNRDRDTWLGNANQAIEA